MTDGRHDHAAGQRRLVIDPARRDARARAAITSCSQDLKAPLKQGDQAQGDARIREGRKGRRDL